MRSYLRKLSRIGQLGAFIAAAALLLALQSTRAQNSAKALETKTPAAADVEKGKRLFTSYGCYECHGREGQGSPYSGARLAPHPLELRAFIAYVRQPKGQMPPYTAKVASDEDLADIRAFLNSVPQPPPAKSIPLLN